MSINRLHRVVSFTAPNAHCSINFFYQRIKRSNRRRREEARGEHAFLVEAAHDRDGPRAKAPGGRFNALLAADASEMQRTTLRYGDGGGRRRADGGPVADKNVVSNKHFSVIGVPKTRAQRLALQDRSTGTAAATAATAATAAPYSGSSSYGQTTITLSRTKNALHAPRFPNGGSPDGARPRSSTSYVPPGSATRTSASGTTKKASIVAPHKSTLGKTSAPTRGTTSSVTSSGKNRNSAAALRVVLDQPYKPPKKL